MFASIDLGLIQPPGIHTKRLVCRSRIPSCWSPWEGFISIESRLIDDILEIESK
ncbi:hypothetical protein LCGC14_2290740, partial [marine sediment metagenome]